MRAHAAALSISSAMRIVSLLLFTACLLGGSLLASSTREVRTPTGILRLDAKTRKGADGYFRGSFRSLSGEGIHFTSQNNYLSVVTLDNRPVIQARVLSDEGDEVYANILGQRFVQLKSSPYMFVIPGHYETENVEAFLATPEGREIFAAKMQIVSDQTTHEAAVMSATRDLASSREAALMEEAARGLGINMGITGKDEPAILPFYLAALQLLKMRDAEEKHETEGQANKRSFYSNVGYYSAHSQGKYPDCDITTCPPCQEDLCLGMCGHRCECWKWVCGDCCFHEGCKDHDLCCRKYGHQYFRCKFHFGLKCSSPYWC